MNVDIIQHVHDFEDEHQWLPGHMSYIIAKTWVTEKIIMEEINYEVCCLHTRHCIPQTRGKLNETEQAFYDLFKILTRHGYADQEKS